MEIRQRTELRKLLVPELNQSLKILSLPLPELKAYIEEEMLNNPLLEEAQIKNTFLKPEKPKIRSSINSPNQVDIDFYTNQLTQRISLQDILIRQLGMFANTDEELNIGQEIIGNIDENGYFKAGVEDVANNLKVPPAAVEKTLDMIQQFEPAGVGARTISECLLIQLKSANENDPLLIKIVESHLEDAAKKNYSRIAKALNEPLEKIEPLIKKVLKLDPKPGRNYSANEAYRIIPDMTIEDRDGELEIEINDEDIPTLNINKDYKEMLKGSGLEPRAKEFLKKKLENALALLRAVSRRKQTLRKIIETIVEIQAEAIMEGLSHLKPLTFKDVAQKLDINESTVCRAVINKYAKTPQGVVALKDFFTSHVHDQSGQEVSSSRVKRLIKELIDGEDKKHPLSDQDILNTLLKEKNLNLSRRTIAKYRESLKILSSTFRKIR